MPARVSATVAGVPAPSIRFLATGFLGGIRPLNSCIVSAGQQRIAVPAHTRSGRGGA